METTDKDDIETKETKDVKTQKAKRGRKSKIIKEVNDTGNRFTGDKETEMVNTLVNNLYDIQKVRISIQNRNRALQEKSKALIFEDHAKRMISLERETVKEISNEISKFKISEWMLGQRGIGPSLAGQIIAIIRDVGRFSNVGKLWAYSGMATMEVCLECGKKVMRSPRREEWIVRVAKRLEAQHNKKKIREEEEKEIIGLEIDTDNNCDEEETNFTQRAKKMLCSCKDPKTRVVAQRRIKACILDYNPKMKKLCRNISLLLIQYNEFYGDLYNGYLEQYMVRDNLLDNINQSKYTPAVLEKIKESKAVKMARRKMVKIFLSHMWAVWRKMEGLEVTKPYAIAVLGHSDYIEPPPGDKQRKEEEEEYFVA